MSEAPTVLTGNLARRLAEAADGLRDNKYYYFVCLNSYPFDLEPVPGNTIEAAGYAADALVAQKGLGYKKYGPYQTPPDDSPGIEYDSIELKFIKQGCDPLIETIDKDVDAIILNLSAYEKFFEPYYARLYGAAVAANMRSYAETSLISSAYVTVKHKGGTLFKAKDTTIG